MRTEITPWLKKVEEAIEESKLIPLWGAPPAFPWEKFTTLLQEALSLPELTARAEKTEWKKAESFLVGLGEKPYITSLELSPLSEACFLAISSEDVEKFTSACLTETHEGKGFSHPDFQEGFFHFLLLQGLQVADESHCFLDLSPKLGKPTSLHSELGGFCHDVRIDLSPKKTVRVRIICPSAFHGAFRAHFLKNKPSLLDSPLAQEMMLPLRIEAGSCSLNSEKWKNIEAGDLLILDRCSFDPVHHKGSVTLSLGHTPLFQARLKEGNLKLLDFAFYNEENMSFSDKEKEFGEEEVPAEDAGPSMDEAETHLWAGEEVEKSEDSSLRSAEDVPLTLTVEIGKLTMSLEKLMQMQPGNLLELGMNPDQTVHLTLEGKRVARGELVKIGDLLGVRILELPT